MATETKKKSIAPIIALIGVLLVAAYLVYKYTQLPKLISDTLNPKYNNGGGFLVDYGDEINTDKVLTLGEKSNNVTRLQTEVNKFITDRNITSIQKLSVDGDYGNKTEAAVIAISNGTLHSGNVTVNKVANLSYTTVGALSPAPVTVTPYSASQPTISAPTFSGGRLSNLNRYSN